jgi:hypothetical protein
MNFLLELKKYILSHPVTSKQPQKIVQIHMGHPVYANITLVQCRKYVEDFSDNIDQNSD